MSTPKISIILPIYNENSQLPETFSRIREQTLTEFEVLCVDDGSTDGSLERLYQMAREDSRFRILSRNHAGAGAARNAALAEAKGEYVIFSDCDDLYSPGFLESVYAAAQGQSADIVICGLSGIDNRGKEFPQKVIQTGFLPRNLRVFCWADAPVNILRITNNGIWNKLYRRSFLTETGLRFDELYQCNTLSFCALALAAARRITWVEETLVRFRFPRLNNPKPLSDLWAALVSACRQARQLPHWEKIRHGVEKFFIEQTIQAMKTRIRDFSAADAAAFYENVHTVFRNDLAGLKAEDISNIDLYRDFLIVQKHDYKTMALLQSRRLIVSITSYPRRIGTIGMTLETIFAQTRPADKVVLWLAKEQFPALEGDLPESLMELVRSGKLTIGWCDDLKGHKKYFYALQEYSEDVVVTIDDDLLYPKDMLATLYKSYLMFPNAVSTMRAHLILLSEDKQILPYNAWFRETDSYLHTPSMQLMASGGAGDLYPPHLLRPETFDHEAVMGRCLWADNLWLKYMELISDVPVVLAARREPLRYVGDTQEETLFQINGDQNQYDVQTREVAAWLEKRFEPGILEKKLSDPSLGATFLTVEEVADYINVERSYRNWRVRVLQDQAEKLQKEKSQALGDLQKAREEAAVLQKELSETAQKLSRKEADLSDCRKELSSTRNQLTDTRQQLRRSEESKPLKNQLKAMDNGSGGLKRLLYCMTWIPGGMTIGMMYLYRHGVKYTTKMIYRKLFRR